MLNDCAGAVLELGAPGMPGLKSCECKGEAKHTVSVKQLHV